MGAPLLSAFLGVHCGTEGGRLLQQRGALVRPLRGRRRRRNLEVGACAITVETPAGVTACDYEVVEPNRQSAEEAEERDEALLECGQNGTCPELCSGPDELNLSRGGLRVDGDPADVTITVENVGTGALAEATFTPSYEDHPEECADCVTAWASMALPVQ